MALRLPWAGKSIPWTGCFVALGLGLRFDVVWFSFIERTTVRFDVAKTVNAASPVQFWLGIQYAF